MYREPPETGNPHRVAFREQTRALIRARFAAAAEARAAYFRPDAADPAAWTVSTAGYRQDLRRLLGWPLAPPEPTESSESSGISAAEPAATPAAFRRELVGSDALGDIYRVHAEALPGWWMYGLWFTPAGASSSAPASRLLVTQHGGLGTPELVANFFEPGNYGDMVQRLRRRGFAVLAPQIGRWNDIYDNPERPDNEDVPRGDPAGQTARWWSAMLAATGGSLLGLEAFGVQQMLTATLAEPETRDARCGMLGLSYGGLMTLLVAALDPRITAAAASACLNDGSNQSRMHDLAWPDGLRRFTPLELAGLVCPRPLAIEIGRDDGHVIVANAEAQARHLRGWYTRLGLTDRFLYHEHDGGHEIDTTSDAVFDFLDRWV